MKTIFRQKQTLSQAPLQRPPLHLLHRTTHRLDDGHVAATRARKSARLAYRGIRAKYRLGLFPPPTPKAKPPATTPPAS